MTADEGFFSDLFLLQALPELAPVYRTHVTEPRVPCLICHQHIGRFLHERTGLRLPDYVVLRSHGEGWAVRSVEFLDDLAEAGVWSWQGQRALCLTPFTATEPWDVRHPFHRGWSSRPV